MRRADRDLSTLSVLGLLCYEPRYTFEIYQIVIDRQMDFLSGVPRTLYHAVDRLAHNELIEAVGSERPGLRPERTIFAITEAGRVDLTRRVRNLLESPELGAESFTAALSFLDCLPTSEVLAALEVRHDELERRVTDCRRKLESASEVLRMRLDYERTRLNTEGFWVAKLISELKLGRVVQAERPRTTNLSRGGV
jgi:DNA-binding PadR family transcriptional regulator